MLNVFLYSHTFLRFLKDTMTKFASQWRQYWQISIAFTQIYAVLAAINAPALFIYQKTQYYTLQVLLSVFIDDVENVILF